MSINCEICNINPAKSYLTKCCKLFVCEQCKFKYEESIQYCVCRKAIVNKSLCTQNELLFKIISQYQNKKQKQCDRCSQIAKIQCKNCEMIFCEQCQKQLHNSIGYSKHIRQPYVQKYISLQNKIQKVKNKPRVCQTHNQLIEFVCQCSAYLCSICIKPHKEYCQRFPLKPKSYIQYKNQYYSQLLFKLTQITNYKSLIKSQHKLFTQHYLQQVKSKQSTKNSIEQQFNSVKKLLELKIEETQKQLGDYWKQCQKVYSKTIYFLQANLKKYDDYAKLIEKCIQNQVGLDYIQKRVKKTPSLIYNGFSFKVLNLNQAKNSIFNISTSQKLVQYQFHQHINLNFTELNQQKRFSQSTKRYDYLSNNISSQILLQISQHPLNSRRMSFNCSHNQIQFNFLHLPYQQFIYEIQYGVGFKMKGKQVFKKIQVKLGNGVIQGLNPSTKYRIRMRVANGDFGQIYEVVTLDSPKFIIQNANFAKLTGQNSFQFLKQGLICGSNPIIFGIHYWTIVLNSQKSAYDQSQTACITLGVLNKQQRKNILVGSTFNYGYQRDQIRVRICLDCEQGVMRIWSSQSGHNEQRFTNLPSYPLYCGIQNKSSATVHIKYMFGRDEVK